MTALRTRPRAVLGSVGLAVTALLLFTGCASSPIAEADTNVSTSSSPSLLPASEGTASYPLTLSTPWGDTVLTQRPERIAIVTAATVDTDALIALGGTPVFAPSTIERNPWLGSEVVTEIEKLWESEAGAEVSVESVAAAKPDLIVSLQAYETFDKNRFEQLSAIAPVLYAPYGELSWQEITQSLGDTVDLGATAKEAVQAAEKTITETRAAHPEFEGATATHVIVYPEEWGISYASYPDSDTARLFDQLGFTLPEVAEQFTDDDTLSNELIGLIDSDFLLISTQKDPDYFLEAPLLQTVPAVATGRAVIDPMDEESSINYFAWGLNQQSALSVPWLIEQLATFGSQALR